MDMPAEPKFVQISTAVMPQSPTLLYALDAAGDVWLFKGSHAQPDHPRLLQGRGGQAEA